MRVSENSITQSPASLEARQAIITVNQGVMKVPEVQSQELVTLMSEQPMPPHLQQGAWAL